MNDHQHPPPGHSPISFNDIMNIHSYLVKLEGPQSSAIQQSISNLEKIILDFSISVSSAMTITRN